MSGRFYFKSKQKIRKNITVVEEGKKKKDAMISVQGSALLNNVSRTCWVRMVVRTVDKAGQVILRLTA